MVANYMTNHDYLTIISHKIRTCSRRTFLKLKLVYLLINKLVSVSVRFIQIVYIDRKKIVNDGLLFLKAFPIL